MATPNEHKKTKDGFIDKILFAFDQFQTKLEDAYEKTVRFTLKKPKSILFISTVIFISSLFLIQFIPKTFLPSNDNGEFIVTVEMLPGTSLEGTRALTEKIEKNLLQLKTIEIVATVIGNNDEANKSSLYVRLVPRSARLQKTSEVKTEVREKLSVFNTECTLAVSDVDIGNSGQKPLNLYLTGGNLETLGAYAHQLKLRMQKIKGLEDVDTNFRTGKPEYHIVFDREKSEDLGVSTVQAGMELRYRTEGAEPAVFRENGLEYKIKLKLAESFRDLKQEFDSTQIPNQNFNQIALSRISKGKSTEGFSQINRQNKNRFISISGNLGAQGSLGSITSEIESILQKELIPPVGVDYRFVGQAEDFKDLLNNMIIAICLGIIFIYLVLASLYESFVIPFSILLALPLAMTGAFLGLLVTGKTIDIFSMIGIVMLLGVVAKNSILLVDYTQQLMNEGFSRHEALVKSCRTRLRPILMTSLALIAGSVPIAIGLNEASAMRTSMGVAIIGGLISSTALTLIVVPAAFGYIDDFRVWSLKMVKGDRF